MSGDQGANPVPEVDWRLRNQIPNHLAMYVRQPEIAASVAVGELLVVEAHELQNCGVQVVNVNFVLDGLEAELVGGPVGLPAFDAAAGQPISETVVVVVSAVDLAGVR